MLVVVVAVADVVAAVSSAAASAVAVAVAVVAGAARSETGGRVQKKRSGHRTGSYCFLHMFVYQEPGDVCIASEAENKPSVC